MIKLGRFIQPDTIVPNPMNPQSLNRYSYVRNNPVNLIDPTGHIDCHTQYDPDCAPGKGALPTGIKSGIGDPVTLTEGAKDLIDFSKKVGMTPFEVIEMGISHEIYGWAYDKESVGLYGEHLSNRFVYYAKHNCSGNLTFNCALNFFMSNYQSIKDSFVENYSDNPEDFKKYETWGRTYTDAAYVAMSGFWSNIDPAYDPDLNPNDRSKAFNTGVVPAAAFDEAMRTNKTTPDQFKEYFLDKDGSTCNGIPSYSIILSYSGDKFFQTLGVGVTQC